MSLVHQKICTTDTEPKWQNFYVISFFFLHYNTHIYYFKYCILSLVHHKIRVYAWLNCQTPICSVFIRIYLVYFGVVLLYMYVPLGQWFFCKNTEELFIFHMNYGASSSRQLQFTHCYLLSAIWKFASYKWYIYVYIDYWKYFIVCQDFCVPCIRKIAES